MTEDHETILRVRSGDTDAFRFLVKRYERPLVCMIRNMIANPQTCEDVAQDVFVSAYQALGTYDPARCRFSTWLFTIARNKCLNALRRKSAGLMAELPERPDRHGPHDRLTEKELFEHLDAALAALPLEQKTAFVLSELVGLSGVEISGSMNVPVGTIRSRLSRARAALRESLSRFAGGDA